jgi:hypothetical protein
MIPIEYDGNSTSLRRTSDLQSGHNIYIDVYLFFGTLIYVLEWINQIMSIRSVIENLVIDS